MEDMNDMIHFCEQSYYYCMLQAHSFSHHQLFCSSQDNQYNYHQLLIIKKMNIMVKHKFSRVHQV